MKFVNGIVVFLGINYLRRRYFHGSASCLRRCLAAFGKSWMSNLEVATIEFHASTDFSNVFVPPPQHNKICRTVNRNLKSIVMDIGYNSLTRRDIHTQSLTSHKDQAQRWYGHVLSNFISIGNRISRIGEKYKQWRTPGWSTFREARRDCSQDSWHKYQHKSILGIIGMHPRGNR